MARVESEHTLPRAELDAAWLAYDRWEARGEASPHLGPIDAPTPHRGVLGGGVSPTPSDAVMYPVPEHVPIYIPD